MPTTYTPLEFVQKTQQLPPCCLLYGNEIQLAEEARAFIYSCFSKDNIERHYWKELYAANFQPISSDGLFANNDSKCIEIIIEKSLGTDSTGTGSNKSTQKALASLLDQIENTESPDTLLINIQEWDDKSKKTAWFKKLLENSVGINAAQLSAKQSKIWINRWAKQFNIKMSDDAIHWLCIQSEGNLLAAKQSIQKLDFNDVQEEVDINTMRKTLADGALYDVYDLINAIVIGDLPRSLYVLRILNTTGTAEPIIMWGINHIIINLLSLKTGETPNMWGANLRNLQNRVSHFSENDLIKLLRHAAFTDRVCKGVAVSTTITLMTQLVTTLVILGNGDKIRHPMFRE